MPGMCAIPALAMDSGNNEATPAASAAQVLPRALTLMTDVFGNYVVQKFLVGAGPCSGVRLCVEPVHALVASAC